MCRLYGFRANEPTKVECTLIHAQNGLLRQSLRDERGRSNADGWGICYYQNGRPILERRATAAFADVEFAETAKEVLSETVVAHVRMATVGDPIENNAHPFVWDRWTFAHNGGLTAFDLLAETLAAETLPSLQRCRAGTTDSEQIFYWLLTRIARAGVSLDKTIGDVPSLTDVVAQSIRELARRNAATGTDQSARLNFVLTNGAVLIASRWKNSLWWVPRDGVRDCEICGVPHVRHQAETDYRAVVVASEPISHEPWQELPDESLLVVNAAVRVSAMSI